MLPNERLSTKPVAPSEFIGARAVIYPQTEDYMEGGVAFQDPSRGLNYQVWKAEIVTTEVNQWIQISAPNTPPIIMYDGLQMTDVSLAFDHSASPVLVFEEKGVTKIHWYDTIVGEFVLTVVGSDIKNAKCALDDIRPAMAGSADVIVAYMKNKKLHYRRQRDRYGVERVLSNTEYDSLIRIGRGRNYRFLFQVV